VIDIHCHILPGLDDGAADLGTSLEMARMAIGDGIATVACTPHIFPGVYDNTAESIEAAVSALEERLAEEGIALALVTGADIHLAPDLVDRLQNGDVPPLNESRYFLFEPPHDILPPRLDSFLFGAMAAGYRPILTHPERLAWIEQHYPLIQALAGSGVVMQLTAGSLTGLFRRRARYWSERMIDEGIAQVIASDAHGTDTRPPIMSPARDLVAGRWGDDLAERLFLANPSCILENLELPDPSVLSPQTSRPRRESWLDRLGLARRGDTPEN
jgi:protein-tyrosine phosphatase